MFSRTFIKFIQNLSLNLFLFYRFQIDRWPHNKFFILSQDLKFLFLRMLQRKNVFNKMLYFIIINNKMTKNKQLTVKIIKMRYIKTLLIILITQSIIWLFQLVSAFKLNLLPSIEKLKYFAMFPQAFNRRRATINKIQNIFLIL